MNWVARRAALIAVTGALAATAAAFAFGPVPAPRGVHRPATARPGGAITAHAAAVTPGQQAGVRRYWTRSRMEHARPVRSPSRGHGSQTHSGQTHSGQTHRRPVHYGRGQGGRGKTAGLSAAVTAARAPLTAARAPAVPAQPPRPPQVRLTAASAATGAPWRGGGAVAHTTGKVFFTLNGQDYVCSGSTVASADADVVVTAAHCVKDGTGAWATNWTFVPGYAGGNDPYGSFTANQFYVASQWSTQADNDYDVAFVTVNPANQAGARVPVVTEVGGQAIEFGRQPVQEVAFGYPADPPYNGGQLYYCGGTVSPDPYHETDDTGLPCAMTAGSSGGPWLAGFSPATGTGTITAVTSFKYSNSDAILYGTPLGSVAQSLYQAAARGG